MGKLTISKWYKWGLYSQGKGEKVLRRYRLINGKPKWETYPADKWKQLTLDEQQSLLRRLNASNEASQKATLARFNYNHAFINTTTILEFEAYLNNRAKDRGYKKSVISSLHKYTFKYFLFTAKNPDPGQWKKYEAGFGNFLLGKKIQSSTIKRIIFNTNRFIKFLHNRWPDEIRLIVLDPISALVLKQRPKKTREKFITEESFSIMCSKCDKRLVPVIKLSYYFGLRLAESLALQTQDLLEDCLYLQRQLIKVRPIRYYDLPKGGKKRDIPYWGCTPEEAYQLILALPNVHPDTAGHLFTDDMIRLNLPHRHHDFRRTFITKATRARNLLDAQGAAGHSDIRTTSGYLQDDRVLSRKPYRPKLVLEK